MGPLVVEFVNDESGKWTFSCCATTWARQALALGTGMMAFGCSDDEWEHDRRQNEAIEQLRDADSVLSLNDVGAWEAQSTGQAHEVAYTDGSNGMAVLAPVSLRSAPFAFAKTPNAVNVAVSGSGVASGTLGAQIYCLEGNVGSWKLEDLDLGALVYDGNGAARARIPIPVGVQNSLAGGCPRLKLEFHMGGAVGASIVLADVSLRVETPPIARESDAMCGLPNRSALVQKTQLRHLKAIGIISRGWLRQRRRQNYRFSKRYCRSTTTNFWGSWLITRSSKWS